MLVVKVVYLKGYSRNVFDDKTNWTIIVIKCDKWLYICSYLFCRINLEVVICKKRQDENASNYHEKVFSGIWTYC